ncbi:MAG TPA: biosynthetic-type acetolactate synthase large subunit [Thermomicrobiales bacterium]|nr:biosynthetic-type acetolactate synthase large subunit [Thermomicrobiales bacterium]HRA33067.1 biosynthetic-type acetolactate synthase large subunit [Thermomicrobiales bacterium]
MVVTKPVESSPTPVAEPRQAAAARPRNGARVLCEALVREGVDTIFGYPGGAVIPLYDVLPEYPRLNHVLVRHEQGAGHAADGFARATGRVGVCLATSGPGATNLVTPIATAMLDSIPMVAITGQVAQQFIGSDAFQEIDITGITLPITKHNFLVRHAADIGPTIQKAFHLASSGRPGPVLVDIPKDVLLAQGELAPAEPLELIGYKPTYTPHRRQIRLAAQEIRNARKPLILAGHGILLSGAMDELRTLAERAQIPVALTLLGIGGISQQHPLCLGMVGMHGFAHANRAIHEADLLIGVGMRFDDRVTGRVSKFAPNARIVHIDIDPAEIGKNVETAVPVVGDARQALAMLVADVEELRHEEWIAEIDDWRQTPPYRPLGNETVLQPQFVMERLSELTERSAVVATDVGQHQMWAAQFYKCDTPNHWITSGGLGTMGFGVPAALGAAIGRPEAEVWAIVGDGGVQMTSFEFATIVQEHANVNIAIINNGYLGMVRQWQQLFHDRNYSETFISQPDFQMLATAYGIPARTVTRREEVDDAIVWARATDGPTLINFVVDQEMNVYPMIPSGGSFGELIEKGE